MAVLTGLAFAHLLEMPATMEYPGDLYVTLQRTLYASARSWRSPGLRSSSWPFGAARQRAFDAGASSSFN